MIRTVDAADGAADGARSSADGAADGARSSADGAADGAAAAVVETGRGAADEEGTTDAVSAVSAARGRVPEVCKTKKGG